MNYFIIRHLMLKDVRHQRIRLILIWITVFSLPFISFYQNEQMQDALGICKAGMALIFCFLIISSLLSAILLDPTCGSTRFLSTRPIQWRTLLLSKVLFVLLFVCMPIVILRLATVWTTGVRLSFPDQMIYLSETAIIGTAIAAIFILPALFFQRYTTVLLTIVGCALFGFLLFAFGAALFAVLDPANPGMGSYDPMISQQERFSLQISSFFVACIIISLTIIPVAVVRYWRPAVPIPLTILLGGLFLAFVYYSFTPEPLDHLDQIFSDTNPARALGEVEPSLRDQIHFHVENMAWDVSRSWPEDSEYAKIRLESRLKEKLVIEGINRPYLLYPIDSKIEASLASKRKINLSRPEDRSASRGYVADYLRLVCGGIAPTNPDYDNFDFNRTLTLVGHDSSRHEPDIADNELPGASIRETMTFGVARIEILAILPFKDGVRFDSTRQSYQISQINPGSTGIHYLLNNSGAPLFLRGDFERSIGMMEENPPFVIINRRTGEILDEKSDSTYYNPVDGLTLRWFSLFRSLPPNHPKGAKPPPLPPNWAEDACVCFYSIEELGTVSYSYSGTVTNVIH